MIEQYKKRKNSIASFIVFFCVILFLLSAQIALALEVQYPTISGQTITNNSTLPEYVKYLFNGGMFVGFFAVFISLTIAGVMFFLSPISAGARTNARDRFSGAISGLLILILTYLIITTINPQLSILKLNSLPPNPPPAAKTKSPGVYFYNQAGCLPTDNSAAYYTSPVQDLGDLKNRVNSVNIMQGANNPGYISILYASINFWGKCLYLNPNNGCQTVSPFASSASIYTYDPNPNGDGVYFYRESYFNKPEGYLKISNSDIATTGGSFYLAQLSDLQFTGDGTSGGCTVPKKEQDCIKYKTDGQCDDDNGGRKCPTLAGENISSVNIKGNYVVLFFYFGPNDNSDGPWTSCQEFPTTDDINKTGPQQIKWQNIRNNANVIPNWVMIMPIKK